MILDGKFACLTISPNGEKLAFIEGRYPLLIENPKIIIADTSGRIIDTIRPPRDAIASWIKFNKDGNKIYYLARINSDTFGYFRINLDGSGEELFFTREGFYYFDLFSDDSLYLLSNAPALHPQNSNYVVYPVHRHGIQRFGDLILKNLLTGEEDSLHADPFGLPIYIDLPSWSPNGKEVVYCVGPLRGDPLRLRKLELWKVENIEIDKRRKLW